MNDSQYDNWKLSNRYDDNNRAICDGCSDILPLDNLEVIGDKVLCNFCAERITDEEE